MENTNTYRAIITGMIILFAGCLIWLLASRRTISLMTTELDKAKLKHEALLSEKLLVEKDLDKTSNKSNAFSDRIENLYDSLEHNSEMLSVQTEENRRIKKALRFAQYEIDRSKSDAAEVSARLLERENQYSSLLKSDQTRGDSIRTLMNTIASLETKLDQAITRSIDQTLILAEKKNDKLTTKARKANELVANVELPSSLNELSFVVEGPNGAALSQTNGSISVRQLAKGDAATASIGNIPVFDNWSTKEMEVVYKPQEKLKAGTYVIRIFNGNDYVGSMRVALQ